MNIISTDRLTAQRLPKFGKGTRTLRRNTPLTDAELRHVAPSIFASEKHTSRSQRYSYIPTSEVLASLQKEGFRPFAVSQGGSRDEVKQDFTKHMIRLRHDSVGEMQAGSTFREIVLVNSHDGTSSYQLMAAMFRLICTNGMVAATDEGDMVRIKHSGDVIPAVIDGCLQILGRLPEVSEQVRQWDGLALSSAEQGAFARAAMALKYEEEEKPFDSSKLLTIRRREDAVPTLWNTLNVIQENVIQGGIGYVLRDEEGRRKQIRRTREVKGIDSNLKLNRGLWILAEEMRKLKAQN